MSQSLSAMFAHLVFSTKDRQPFLSDPVIRAEMHAFLGGTSAKLDCPTLIVGGVADHVHILGMLDRSITQKEWVKEVKRVSSIWIKEREPSLHGFAWQAGYGVFSVSMSNTDRVIAYIADQEERHRRTAFQTEFRGLLRKHKITWDERYVWD